MIVIIQDAEGRRPEAGHLTARNGNRVLFVADPAQAPEQPGVCHARPDAFSSFGATWRQLVYNYNANPKNNPLGLLPAHAFYPDAIYAELLEALGAERCYVLSPAWGLVRASFLTPNYDISLDPGAEPYRRRSPGDRYADFRLLPADADEDLYLFANAEYVPLFCRLTTGHPRRRIVFHDTAEPPEAPGCILRKFDARELPQETGTPWHHVALRSFLADRRQRLRRAKSPAPRVSNIETRLRATMKRLSAASRVLPGGLSEADTHAVRAASRHAQQEIMEFEWLAQTLLRIDVQGDSDYQQRFNTFHGIGRRSSEWFTAYYKALEQAKAGGATFASVLDILWEETGRYEPWLASCLVATVDPAQPIWDRFALMHTGLGAPSYLDGDKLSKAADLYRQLGNWYRERLGSPAGTLILELFDQALPGHEALVPLKKLEFVLRHLRAGPSPFGVTGQFRMSAPPAV